VTVHKPNSTSKLLDALPKPVRTLTHIRHPVSTEEDPRPISLALANTRVLLEQIIHFRQPTIDIQDYLALRDQWASQWATLEGLALSVDNLFKIIRDASTNASKD
jgi:hypothetical protein